MRPRIVVLSGAGLSADSGIATYRGDGGVYRGALSEDVMGWRTLRDAPELIHGLCDDRRVELGRVRPNAAHEAVAELARRYGDQFVHFTQNIDDLVERTGFNGSVHVHGLLTRMRSVGNSKIEVDIGYKRYWSGSPEDAPDGGFQFRCPKSNSRFRPAVVLYGEAAPLYVKLWQQMRRLRSSDLLIVIGTEGAVLPIDMWARQTSAFKVLNNLDDAAEIDAGNFDVYLKERAETAAEKILQIAEDHMSGFKFSR
jgi:NAD-dependent protein deacetylases, SIR2 family